MHNCLWTWTAKGVGISSNYLGFIYEEFNMHAPGKMIEPASEYES